MFTRDPRSNTKAGCRSCDQRQRIPSIAENSVLLAWQQVALLSPQGAPGLCCSGATVCVHGARLQEAFGSGSTPVLMSLHVV